MRFVLIPVLTIVILSLLSACSKDSSEKTEDTKQENTGTDPVVTPAPLPPSFEELSKTNNITFTFTNSDVISKLSNTIGAPSYEKVWFQKGASVTNAQLESGYDHRSCSMVATAFVTKDIPMLINSAKVKERDMFGTKILEIYDIGSGVVAAECQKMPPKPEKEYLAQRANPITPDDLREIFGPLVIVTLEKK